MFLEILRHFLKLLDIVGYISRNCQRFREILRYFLKLHQKKWKYPFRMHYVRTSLTIWLGHFSNHVDFAGPAMQFQVIWTRSIIFHKTQYKKYRFESSISTSYTTCHKGLFQLSGQEVAQQNWSLFSLWTSTSSLLWVCHRPIWKKQELTSHHLQSPLTPLLPAGVPLTPAERPWVMA